MASEQPWFARQWLAQWKSAAVELEKVRLAELRKLSDAEALAASEALLSMPMGPLPEERRTWSGLVEQQRLFMLLRSLLDGRGGRD